MAAEQILCGCIWMSLLHLYAAENIWLEALGGNEDPLTPGDVAGKLPGNQEGPDAIATLSELQIEWEYLAEQWSRYLASLSPDWGANISTTDEPSFQTTECLSSYNSAFQELAVDPGVVNILPLSYVAR